MIIDSTTNWYSSSISIVEEEEEEKSVSQTTNLEVSLPMVPWL